MAAGLAIEILPLAMISMLAWGGRTMKLGLRAAIFIVATILCIVAVAVMTPAVLRGVAEQSGWIAGSVHHASGAHELPLPRIGIALTARRRSCSPFSQKKTTSTPGTTPDQVNERVRTRPETNKATVFSGFSQSG